MTVMTGAVHTGAPAMQSAIIRTAWHAMTRHTTRYLGLFKCVNNSLPGSKTEERLRHKQPLHFNQPAALCSLGQKHMQHTALMHTTASNPQCQPLCIQCDLCTPWCLAAHTTVITESTRVCSPAGSLSTHCAHNVQEHHARPPPASICPLGSAAVHLQGAMHLQRWA